LWKSRKVPNGDVAVFSMDFFKDKDTRKMLLTGTHGGKISIRAPTSYPGSAIRANVLKVGKLYIS